MIYRLAADLLVVLHILFVLFVLFGGLLALRWRWVWPVHLLSAAWGALIEFKGWICPLTPLENSMRQLGGESGYTGGFIENYLVPIVYPGNLTQELQYLFGAIVIILNIVIYIFVVNRFRKRKQQGRGAI